MSTKIRTLLSHRIIIILVSVALITCVAFAAFTLTSTRTSAHAQASSQAAFSESCPALQAEGNTGAEVQVIQFRLNSLNAVRDILRYPYGNPFPLATDGDFGPKTNEAVLDFQSYFGLTADGIVGNQTWSAMGFCYPGPFAVPNCCSSATLNHCPATLEEGDTGTFVADLQRGLNKDAAYGFIGSFSTTWFPLSIDGDFGPLTKAAVQSLQQTGNIRQDGIVGPMTWGVFGMCY